MPTVKKEHLVNIFSELNSLRLEKEQFETKFDQLNLEKQALKTEKEQLESKFKEISLGSSTLLEEKKEFHSKYLDASLKLDNLKSDFEQLQLKLVKVNSAYKSLEAENESFQSKFVLLNADIDVLKIEREQLKSKIVGINTDIEILRSEKEQLKSANTKSEGQIKFLKKVSKRNNVIFIILLAAFIGLSFMFFFNAEKYKTELKTAKQNKLSLVDSIQKLNLQSTTNSQLIPLEDEISKPEVIYTLQLGIFKNIEVDFNNEKNLNFKVVKTDEGNIYQLGAFNTYKLATLFKGEIKKMGFKDVFLVPYNKKDERIPIKEALILSNEREFIVE